MPKQAAIKRDFYPADDALATRHELMNVKPVADSELR
jgi:hypothetical protein